MIDWMLVGDGLGRERSKINKLMIATWECETKDAKISHNTNRGRLALTRLKEGKKKIIEKSKKKKKKKMIIRKWKICEYNTVKQAKPKPNEKII